MYCFGCPFVALTVRAKMYSKVVFYSFYCIISGILNYLDDELPGVESGLGTNSSLSTVGSCFKIIYFNNLTGFLVFF